MQYASSPCCPPLVVFSGEAGETGDTTAAAAISWIMSIRIMATKVETTVTMAETMTTIIKPTRQSACWDSDAALEFRNAAA
jgi:hypothetical protein